MKNERYDYITGVIAQMKLRELHTVLVSRKFQYNGQEPYLMRKLSEIECLLADLMSNPYFHVRDPERTDDDE